MKFSDKFIQASNEFCDVSHFVPAPYLRKTFTLPSRPEKAEITICGEGFYELTVNGTPVTKGPLAPYISNPDDICYYDRYDVAEYLTEGTNAIGILLGNGFRNAFGGEIWDFHTAECRGPVVVALSFSADCGKKTVSFEADETFLTHASPIFFDDERWGCRYDARQEIPGWDLPDFDDSGWAHAQPAAKPPKGEAKLCTANPIVVTDRLAPVSIKYFENTPYCYTSTREKFAVPYESTRKNFYMYDFGVNGAGVTELRVKNTKPGQVITIRHGEAMTKGTPNMRNIMFIKQNMTEKYLEFNQTDVYICRGADEEVFLPRFKYDGFSYALVEGLEPEQATKDALTFLVMNSDLSPRATFSSSDNTLNRLFEMGRRSDLSNFYYFPTDCPHREKNGWTGDAAMSSEHMLLNLRGAAGDLAEWLANIRKAQREDGAIPGIIPTSGWGFAWGNGPAYDEVIVMLPYYIYKFEGDRQVITDNKEMILRYFRYIMSRRDERGLIACGLGDWIDPFEPITGRISSPLEVTDSIMVYDIARKSEFLFGEVGLDDAAAEVGAYAKEMREAIRKHLIKPSSMKVSGYCQTSQVFALECGIFNEDEIPEARKMLSHIIHRNGEIIATGMIGLRHIFHALIHAGLADLAMEMMIDTGRTGYGSWVEKGCTALWESFERMGGGYDSMNHHFLGDITSVMIQDFAGIAINPGMRDIHSFRACPCFPAGLDNAEASYDYAPGETLRISWKRTDGGVTVDLTVPACAHGTFVPYTGWTAEGEIPAELTAGSYRFTLKKC